MARLMLLLLLIVPSILTSTAESGQKVIQFKILRFHHDNYFSLTLPKLNVMALIFALNILSYGVLWAIDAYPSFTRRSQRSKI